MVLFVEFIRGEIRYMQLSTLSNRLVGQPMFQLLAKVKELEKRGKRIIHMEIGDSNFPTPEFVIDVTKRALDEGYTHYCPSMGLSELREAICDYTKKDLGFRPDIEQVLICPANAIIDFVVRCICDEGERKIVFPDPGFPSYSSVSKYNGVNDFQYDPILLSPAKIERILWLVRPALLIINSPNNPTGVIIPDEEGARLIYNSAKQNGCFLFSDEVYSKIIFEGQHHSPAIYDQCKERVVLLQSFSKLYSMSGFRLGYAIGPKELINKMGLMLETIISCVPPFIQKAGVAILRNEMELYTWLQDKKYILCFRRRELVDGLNRIPGFSCSLPPGGFYAWCNIEETGYNDLQLADILLEKAGIACLPGRYFGGQGEGYIRFCFASVIIDEIEEALEKIKKILEK